MDSLKLKKMVIKDFNVCTNKMLAHNMRSVLSHLSLQQQGIPNSPIISKNKISFKSFKFPSILAPCRASRSMKRIMYASLLEVATKYGQS